MKRRISLLIMTVLVLSGFTVLGLRRSESQPSSPDAVLYISPSIIADPTITPPATIAINVSISNVANMAYCEFNMSYIPNIFYIVELAKQPIQGQFPSIYCEIEDYLGYLYMRLTYKSPVTVNGNATLLILNLAVVDYGITTLHFHDVTVKDGNSQIIPTQTQDGYIAIIKHDIAVTGVSYVVTGATYVSYTNETFVGRTVKIVVTLHDYGDVPEDFTATISAGGINISALQIQNLQPNETRDVVYDWNTSDFQPSMSPYGIKAEAEVLPYETNATNNVCVDGQVKLKLVGDVNGDGNVDINDLNAWNAALGSHPGDPNWNPQADINGDGVVDKQDGVLIIENYGNHL